MHCYICDKMLGDDDIKFNRLHQDYDPCGECKQIIAEAVHETGDPDEVEDLGYDDGVDYGIEAEEPDNG